MLEDLAHDDAVEAAAFIGLANLEQVLKNELDRTVDTERRECMAGVGDAGLADVPGGDARDVRALRGEIEEDSVAGADLQVVGAWLQAREVVVDERPDRVGVIVPDDV